ncbi:MAG: V-type ATP synthase subunit A, partial [Candidatus Omnitrophica bacterium CG_4_9_14_0_2_um_filter_42_8]
MSAERFGILTGINGNMARVEFEDYVMQNEVAFILHNEERLKSEVIRVAGNIAELQIYEDTKGLKLGEKVEFTGELLSVKLGPGLLGQIFDGLQNPLPQLAEKSGFFLKRGLYLEALDDKAEWEFTPVAKSGQSVKPGEKIGFTKEGIFEHWIMAPFGLKNAATVVKIANKGKYNIKHAVAELKDERGNTSSVTMA